MGFYDYFTTKTSQKAPSWGDATGNRRRAFQRRAPCTIRAKAFRVQATSASPSYLDLGYGWKWLLPSAASTTTEAHLLQLWSARSLLQGLS